MSLRVKVTAPKPAQIAAKLRKIHDPAFLQQLQAEVVEGQIKKLIRAGRSPVEGFGRFPQYKDREKYPANKKAKTPVNLTLSGLMLKFFGIRKKSDRSITVGIFPEASNDLKVRARANNEGTENGIPARRFIPINGERFTVSVMRAIKNLYAKRVKELLSKKN